MLKVLKVAGIVRQPSSNGYYSLILEEAGGTRRLQIIIGPSEAHSIECVLRKIMPPRPLTHDLLADIIRRFKLSAEGVIIELLPGNIYGARIILSDGTRKENIDARSSDAVALAVRLGIPLYASSDLLNNEGIKAPGPVVEPITTDIKDQSTTDSVYNHKIDFSGMSDDQLRRQLKEAARAERYELASLIKAELDRRKTNTQP